MEDMSASGKDAMATMAAFWKEKCEDAERLNRELEFKLYTKKIGEGVVVKTESGIIADDGVVIKPEPGLEADLESQMATLQLQHEKMVRGAEKKLYQQNMKINELNAHIALLERAKSDLQDAQKAKTKQVKSAETKLANSEKKREQVSKEAAGLRVESLRLRKECEQLASMINSQQGGDIRAKLAGNRRVSTGVKIPPPPARKAARPTSKWGTLTSSEKQTPLMKPSNMQYSMAMNDDEDDEEDLPLAKIKAEKGGFQQQPSTTMSKKRKSDDFEDDTDDDDDTPLVQKRKQQKIAAPVKGMAKIKLENGGFSQQ